MLLFKTLQCVFILKIVFIFRERGREGEREGEKHPWKRETLCELGDLLLLRSSLHFQYNC